MVEEIKKKLHLKVNKYKADQEGECRENCS
jgi:hypothetical protein